MPQILILTAPVCNDQTPIITIRRLPAANIFIRRVPDQLFLDCAIEDFLSRLCKAR